MRASVIAAFLLTACLMPKSQVSDLSLAVRDGDAARIRHLVTKGADPNAPSGNNDWTPLLHAVHTHRNDSIAALLDAGADVNRPGGHHPLTPLELAAAYGYDDTVRLLLQRGAKPDAAALDAALTGTPDIDRFTFFVCQDSTVQLIRGAAPGVAPSASARRWARIKRCGATS